MARRTRILPLAIWRGLWCLRTDRFGICVGVEPPQDVKRQITCDAQYHPVFTGSDLLQRDGRAFLGAAHNGLEIGRWAGLYAIVFPAGALFGYCWFLYFFGDAICSGVDGYHRHSI